MSTSTPSETPALTAAEKAEIRRRKILAKKHARMEYAAGKRTVLPSEAPSEPIHQMSPQAPRPSTDADPLHITYEAQRPFADRLVAVDPSLPRQNVFSAAFSVFNAGVMRLTILTLLAMVYTAAVTFEYIPRWQVSAVELFFSAEVCFLVPGIIEAIRNRSKRMAISTQHGEALPFTMLRLLSNIQDSVLLVRRIVNEFSLFMFVFLCTWYTVNT